MSEKIIFLSHIHEESELAILIKNAIEDEFSGFVQVFVSSDGGSIKAGDKFLNKIESALAECIGAIYLISPTSVKRNWVNFELGAVWIRNVLSKSSGGQEIPALPICHSGLTPSKLPSPLNNLNGINCADPVHLQFAFSSLQSAVGGRGSLKTDFAALASKAMELERIFTQGEKLTKLFSLLGDHNRDNFCKYIESRIEFQFAEIRMDFLTTESINTLREIEHSLDGQVTYVSDGWQVVTNGKDQLTGSPVNIKISTKFFMEHKHLLK